MNETLARFLSLIRPQGVTQAATSPLTAPQAGMLNRLFGLAATQAQGAMQAAPEQLARSRQMLSEWQPGQEVSPELMNQFLNLTGFAPMGITAYHGSPYLFRQFDPTKVGAGEGAQAYGVGAGYTAEARPVAEEYARNISRQKMREGTVEGPVVQQMIGDMPIQDFYAKLDKQAARLPPKQAEEAYAKLDIVERLGLGTNVPEIRQYVKDSGYSKAVQNWVEKELIPKYKPAGYLYKGDIPDELLPKFLDLDKPISQQSEELRKILEPTLTGYGIKGTGSDLYKELTDNFIKEARERVRNGEYISDTTLYGQQKATEYLNNLGIRGIRYLDQGSRDVGKGTSNFIPFRPEDYKIQEINDIPIEQWYAKGLLDRPLSKVEEAKAAWEANPDNQELYQIYRQLRLGE